jgi:two-component system response regulator
VGGKIRGAKGAGLPLDLGNRFARNGIEMELPDLRLTGDPNREMTDGPALLPEIWKLFEREPSDQALLQKAEVEAKPQAELEGGMGPPFLANPLHSACQVIEILLVEDNPGHVRLMQEALKEANVEFSMNVVEDGTEAMAFLRREGKYTAAGRPQLILLDLNLPKKDGREVLAEIKTDKEIGSIPVIVLTASTDDEDVRTSYLLQANCYITKPVNLDEFVNVVKMIENFWGSFVRLP